MEAGRRIGKYVLDERIAVGGMAEVWAAHAVGLQGFVKPLALKFILESFAGDPELERLFVNEARVAARLQHANLVAVFDFDKVDQGEERGLAGRYYIAMERVDGHDLRRIAEAARHAGYSFPASMVLYVAGEVLKALRYVHEKREAGRALGLVHRDVSPHNVLVGTSGEVKLSDFGIAKAREHSARNTKPGSLRGKIAYASPEQLGGQSVDHRTDQFAAGVTIWELLAGRRLFDGATDMEILGRVARCEIPSLAEACGRRDVPPAVEAALRRMLAADPGARFGTTGDALAAVLALPGYTPDGTALGDLVRTLFRSAMPDLSHTLPIQASPVAPRAAEAPTRTMHQAVGRVAASASAPSALDDGSVSRTADVRSGPRVPKVAFVAVALGLAVAGFAWTRARETPASSAPSTVAAPAPAAPATPAAAATPAVVPAPSVAAASAPAAPNRAVAAVPAPALAGAPTLAPSAAPAPAAPAVPRPDPSVAAAAAPRGHRGAHREPRRDQGPARAPTPAAARAVAPAATPSLPAPVDPAVRRSANGAPIIE